MSSYKLGSKMYDQLYDAQFHLPRQGMQNKKTVWGKGCSFRHTELEMLGEHLVEMANWDI